MFAKLYRSIFINGVVLAALGAVCQAQSLTPLTRHVREVTRNGAAKLIAQLPGDKIMTLDMVLPLSDAAGLDAFLKELYGPDNPSYKKFLTVKEFTERFGPTQVDYEAAVRFAKENGLQAATAWISR